MRKRPELQLRARKGGRALMPRRKKDSTTREKRKRRPPIWAEVIAILGAAAGLITAIAHLIQALK